MKSGTPSGSGNKRASVTAPMGGARTYYLRNRNRHHAAKPSESMNNSSSRKNTHNGGENSVIKETGGLTKG
ncbi:hypothetical protein NPIL_274971 [Nephila pilipes]|uniref:Uncharacterized protein n=1 Tax=Nephila pilipes TaxID=299642 RepID=A0A8X6U979_NEPPI|nr:hypothetical protein NPIL_274971 [Nephila pilipes]